MDNNKCKCECGSDMTYYKSQTTEEWYKIGEDGKLEKTTFETNTHSKHESLMCNDVDCQNAYFAAWVNGKLTRGTKIG